MDKTMGADQQITTPIAKRERGEVKSLSPVSCLRSNSLLAPRMPALGRSLASSYTHPLGIFGAFLGASSL